MHRAYLVLLAILLSCGRSGPDAVRQAPKLPGWDHLGTVSGELAPPGQSEQQTASLVADIDLDGVNDFVIGCRQAPPSMVWYRRTGDGWQRMVIDSATLGVEAGGAVHDIDEDGDPDIVMGGDYSSSSVWWWENPCPDFAEGRDWTRSEIKSGGQSKHHDQIFGDFDGDGAAELMFWNQGADKLFRARIPENPREAEPWTLEEVYSWGPAEIEGDTKEYPSWMASNEHEGFAAADIDGDGVSDLIGGGRWFKFSGGETAVEVIDPAQHFSRAAAGQLIEGGAPEVVFVIGDGRGPIRLYEKTDNGWRSRDLLGHDLSNAHSLQVMDLDGDSHLDIFCAEMRLNGANPDAKVFAFLGDGTGRFETKVVREGYGNHESRAADLDGDGDIDILGKPYNWRTPRLDIWLNRGAGFRDTVAVPFEHMVIDRNGPQDPHTKTVGDLDGDGTEDLVICSSAGGPLVWYRAPRWDKRVIAPSGRWSCDAEAADMDGDGDRDIVISEYYEKNLLEWYENPGDPASSDKPWKRHEIGSPRAHDIETADLDGDGDTDLLARGQSGFGTEEGDRIHVWLQGPGNKWSHAEIACPHGEGLAAGDVDSDGLPDAVIGGRWYRNPGREGSGWEEHLFAEWHHDAVVRVADMNADGRLDAVMTEAETTGDVCWFEQPAGESAAWTRHLIGGGLEKGHSLAVADLDGDNDPDVVTAEMHQSEDPDYVLAFINGGGGLEWRRQVLGESGSHFVRAGDFDGDGDTDIFGANWKSVAEDSLTYVELWRNNLGGTDRLPLGRWKRRVVDSDKPWRAVFINAADMDRDGLRDIVTGGWWYRNPGSSGERWKRTAFGGGLRNMAAVHDFDSDGDPDVLGTAGKGSEPSADFVWARNNGSGEFELLDNIPPARGDFLQGIAVAGAAPGGQLVAVLSWHQADNGIQAYLVPDNPSSGDWQWMRVTRRSQDEQLSAGDIDNDGDIDLLLGTLWLENHGGDVELHTLFETEGSPDRNRLADINGDGRLDAVVGYEAINVPGKLAWYENPADSRGPWTEHVICEPVGPMSLDARDMDGDGDIDIVVGEHNYDKPETARLLVLENTDGTGEHWREYVVHTGDEHHDGAVTADMDNDGDLDIISIGWSHPRVLLYENLAARK